MLISKFSTDSAEVHIARLEQKCGIALPRKYKNFLRKYNGGYTPKTGFEVGEISSDLRGFFGTGNVGLRFDDLPLSEWVNNNLLPVACDSFGNLVVINLGDGSVHFYDHEEENNLKYLTTNFEEFLCCCTSEKISSASRRSIKEREETLIAKGRGHIITDALRQMWQAEIDKYDGLLQEEVLLD